MNPTLQAYIRLMRLDKPIGTMLALYPVLFALWLANDGMPPFRLLIIFILGTLIMRTAGCVINDITDRKFDKQVARTKTRPLAAGTLSVKSAWVVFILLMLAALLLVLQLNTLSIQIAFAIAGLVLLYPWCKRFLPTPQLILGITFNAGVLMAYSASLNELPAIAWILFLCCIFWTLAYDTLYAMADKADDLKIGIQSTAIFFGRYDLIATCVFYFFFFIGLIYLGWHTQLGLFYTVGVLCAVLSISYPLYKARSHTATDCFNAFERNFNVGLWLFCGIFFAQF